MPPKKIELLAPAGNFEKLEIAFHYGADAAYIGGKAFSLRNFSGNFTLEEIDLAVTFAHAQGKKVYVACNIFARNRDLPALADYLDAMNRIRPDAIIVSDPGVLAEARRRAPGIPLHLSTQANTTNARSARFWAEQGVARINAARELSLSEIAEMTEKSPVEIEAFVHGAMCISYSGRCLLSDFLANRSSNQGECTQSCRWKYAVTEETRPGKYYPLAEDDHGAYVFNSRDLCMIGHIPDMIRAGIAALKIEGRMKGINYTATVVKVYREAIDSYYADPAAYTVNSEWTAELNKISRRGYCTGFYFGHPDETVPNYDAAGYAGENRFLGRVTGNGTDGLARVDVRNRIFQGDAVEIIRPGKPTVADTVKRILDADGRPLQAARSGTTAFIGLNAHCRKNDLIRRVQKET